MTNEFATADQRAFTSGQTKKSDEVRSSATSLGEQALSAGRELKDKALDLADTSKDALKENASEFVEAAKDVASQATDKIKQAVDDRKSTGADYVGSLADAARRAAREFETDLPLAATYIRKAATQIEGMSEHIRTGNLSDVVRNAQSFARRQPTAFLGIAVLAGFGAVRFLKSSSEESRGPDVGTAINTPPDGAKSGGYRDDFSK